MSSPESFVLPAAGWFGLTFPDLARQMRWSYLPPLMVYFAAGVSGLTSIVAAFFIKDYLNLSAAFLAGLGFWAGIPWVMKMPLGHLVDIVWRQKGLLIFAGAGLIAASLLVMYALVAHTAWMAGFMSVESWFVLASLMAPSGYVVQDVVAGCVSPKRTARTVGSPSASRSAAASSSGLQAASVAFSTRSNSLLRRATISG
jgi:hypothetical protein